MFEVNGKKYELKFSIKRVQMIEEACGIGLMEVLTRSRGMLPLQVLMTCVAFGMLGEDGVFIATKSGYAHAEHIIEENSYNAVDAAVVGALQRDCPFFFQAG